MAKMSVEIEGSAEEVVRVIQRLGGAVQRPAEGDAGGSLGTPAVETPMSGAADEASAVEWTETLAGEFLAGLEPAARRVARYIWQGRASGIHRSARCQRAELTPGDLHSLLMRMGHALRRFQREHGLILSRPAAANSPLQSYFVDPEFAAAAESRMFDERMAQPLADGTGCP